MNKAIELAMWVVALAVTALIGSEVYAFTNNWILSVASLLVVISVIYITYAMEYALRQMDALFHAASINTKMQRIINEHIHEKQGEDLDEVNKTIVLKLIAKHGEEYEITEADLK